MKIRLKQPNFATKLFELGMTQKELADKSGVSRVTINGIYNGRTCSLESAGKIAKALGVDVRELLED